MCGLVTNTEPIDSGAWPPLQYSFINGPPPRGWVQSNRRFSLQRHRHTEAAPEPMPL
jgi:hypothetical protein